MPVIGRTGSTPCRMMSNARSRSDQRAVTPGIVGRIRMDSEGAANRVAATKSATTLISTIQIVLMWYVMAVHVTMSPMARPDRTTSCHFAPDPVGSSSLVSCQKAKVIDARPAIQL